MSDQFKGTKLQELCTYLSGIMAGLRWCVAGGAVRDHLIGVEPKDYDVFVMEDEAVVRSRLPRNSVVEPQRPEPFLVETHTLLGLTVQFMAVPHCKTASDVLDGFDWDVSRFAFDGKDLLAPGVLPVIGAEMTLHQCSHAASTLNRGIRFAKRFKMWIPDSVAADLVRWAIKEGETP